MIILNDRCLKSQLINLFKYELMEVGYDVSRITETDKILYAYFVMCKRLVNTKKRHVYKSNVFSCPQELQEALNMLENAIENGENINPYLSRRMKETDYQDKLLFDWNVYHLHLGTTKDADGYITRTGALLFAMINDEGVYFINIYSHNDQWSDKDMLNIVNNNWPELLDTWKVNATPEVEYTNEDIKQFRKCNVNTIIKLDDGTSLLGPGMGLNAAGGSAGAMINVIDKIHEIKGFHQVLVKWVMEHPQFEGYDETKIVRKGDEILCELPYHKFSFKLYQFPSLYDRIYKTK